MVWATRNISFEQFEIAGIGLRGNQVLLGALQALFRLGQKRSHDFFRDQNHSLAFFFRKCAS